MANIWSCGSVGRATCSGGHGFEPNWGQIFFLKISPCGPISFLGLMLRRYYLGYLLEHFNLPHLNLYIYKKVQSDWPRNIAFQNQPITYNKKVE